MDEKINDEIEIDENGEDSLAWAETLYTQLMTDENNWDKINGREIERRIDAFKADMKSQENLAKLMTALWIGELNYLYQEDENGCSLAVWDSEQGVVVDMFTNKKQIGAKALKTHKTGRTLVAALLETMEPNPPEFVDINPNSQNLVMPVSILLEAFKIFGEIIDNVEDDMAVASTEPAKENLIVRTMRRVTRLFKNKVAKHIASLALAGAVGLGLTGCFSNNSSTDSSDTTSNASEKGKSTTQYSQILQDVLKDENYNNLIDEHTGDFNYVYVTTQAMDPNPYSFFEENGIDVSAVKSGELECFTIPYFKENDQSALYLSTRVETTISGYDCYANYVLKYILTKQEYNDLTMLRDGNYVQYTFFIQELSKQKTPKVESSMNIYKNTYNAMLNRSNRSKVLSASKTRTFTAVDFVSYQEIEDNIYNYTIRFYEKPTRIDKNCSYSQKTRTANFTSNILTGFTTKYDMISMNNTGAYTFNNVDEFNNNPTTIYSMYYPTKTLDLNDKINN